MAKDKSTMPEIRASAAEYLTFIAASGQGGVVAIYADEDVWLSQKMMTALYDVNVRTVNEHLKKSLLITSCVRIQLSGNSG